uniref:Uncharacterized protein n=1 Tax=Ananas comosus var. bracteatus TaxID=296719 RepID=A0A6V7PWN4_ANACO|nr:unnamed protein product [Ananas comosus var. bracteatus]
METCSAGEDITAKRRKPYTITKQREKWTEEEHNKFLKALKLYGRAWQRIQEHIGTKTAVQIRSHAQKFFSKLEKEALTKGTPVGQSHDIEIPPPRPKRKSTCPYPRNTAAGSLSPLEEANDGKALHSTPLRSGKQVLCVDVDTSHEKLPGTEAHQRKKQPSEAGSSSEVFHLFQVAPGASISSANKSSSNTCTFKHYIPLVEGGDEKTAQSETSQNFQKKQEQVKSASYTDADNLGQNGVYMNWKEKLTYKKKLDVREQRTIRGPLLNNDLRGAQCYSKHVPEQFMSHKNNESSKQSNFSGNYAPMKTNVQVNTSQTNPTTMPEHNHNMNSTTMPSADQPCSVFVPFTQSGSNQDASRTFLSPSSSSLMVSNLLHNPAIHAVASLAASYWSSNNSNASSSSTLENNGAVPNAQVNSSPSMVAMAAATVAAASAWWTSNGLLPLFPPVQPAFIFPPMQTMPISTMDMTRAPEHKEEKKDDRGHKLSQHNVVSKALSSESESDESRRDETLRQAALKSMITNKPKSRLHDSDKAALRTPIRSSNGSNTPSSGDVETDGMKRKLQREVKDKDEQIHLVKNHLPEETSNYQNSSKEMLDDSRKGRPASLELFTGENLRKIPSLPPQSEDKEATALMVDLIGEAFRLSTKVTAEPEEHSKMNEIERVKLKSSRRAFKPYKRCSVEVDNQATTNEDSSDKRLRLGG